MNIPMRHTNKRAGRKRLEGRVRDAQGKTKQVESVAPGIIREILNGALRRAQDDKLRTELGRLFLTEVITEKEYEAGEIFMEIVAAYDRLKGMPPRHMRGVDFMGSHGASLKSEPDDRTVERAEARYEDALHALGPRATAVINVVVCDRMAPDEVARLDVKNGLAHLASAFRLTSPTNAVNRKNAD